MHDCRIDKGPNRRTSSTPCKAYHGGTPHGTKPALKAKEVWAIRNRLQLAKRVRDLVLFNPAIDSKLRGCDLVRLRVGDVAAAGDVKARTVIVQKKTGRPVQFEITEQTRMSGPRKQSRTTASARSRREFCSGAARIEGLLTTVP